MPKKKIRKEKTREYLENLLDNAGLSDKILAEAIVKGVRSENSTERTKALDIASQWKGFKDVDKKIGEEIERLPIGSSALEDVERLTNRCAYCRHGKFEPCKKLTDPNADIPGIPANPAQGSKPGENPIVDGEQDVLDAVAERLNEQDQKETAN